MGAATTHKCPAPGCGTQVPQRLLTCRGHWYLISRPTRERLLAEYAESFGERSYFEARAQCLRELGLPEREIADLNAGVA